MKRHDIIFWLFSLCAVIVSCATDDSVSENTDKRYEFVLSVGSQKNMRMANEVVQVEETAFRGIQKLYVIPFCTSAANPVTIEDFPLISVVMGSETNKVTRSDNEKFYYIARCSLRETANRVLVYGQAASITGKTTDDQNGRLVTGVGETYIKPTDIKFNLLSICEKEDASTDDIFQPARDLATYLTNIANTEGWSTTTDETLRQLYKEFIEATPDGTGLLAGSAAYVKEHVKSLKSQLDGRTDDLSEAIKTSIGDIDNVACLQNQYPSSLGLPDGVAALRWSGTGMGSQFSVRTTTTTLDNINNVSRYTYPAELWYYVNSAIKTSTKEVGRTAYETENWTTVLGHYDKQDVTVDTKSVAVNNPLQYGVARLHTVLTTAVTDCPLTAVIVGGQHAVGFDFLPKVPKSDVDARFIYDKVVSGTETNTLVLQSYDGEKVPVVLEFQNNGSAFTGRDGIVYPGTKFYLVAYLDPAGKGEGDCAGRVFTQDFTTTVQMTVSSKENAYTCIPDLLEPRLEIGVQVVTQWIQSTTTTVKL